MAIATNPGTLFRNERRAALGRDPRQTGVDYIDVRRVARAGWVVTIQFVPPAPGVQKDPIPPGITHAQIIFLRDDKPLPGLRVDSVQYPAPGRTRLRLNVSATEEERAEIDALDSPLYTLKLLNVPNVDPIFNSAEFSFEASRPHRLDPLELPSVDNEGELIAEINYLAKDFQSFRTQMLDSFSLLLPEWGERNISDMGVAMIEVLAYAGDYLSYYQDAVGTESYLGTARRRISVRRHARLLDYTMHEGCNARTWVQIQVDDDGVDVAKGTQLLTKCGREPVIDPRSSDYERALLQKGAIFETMHDVRLYQAHNNMHFYTWGAGNMVLEKGSTKAVLEGHLGDLRKGDVLILEPIVQMPVGTYSDPRRRHVVRLCADPQLGADPLYNDAPITSIEWYREDALPFDVPLANSSDEDGPWSYCKVRGNIVLADHGRTRDHEQLPDVLERGIYAPRLSIPGLVFTAPLDLHAAREKGAAGVLEQDPRYAMPVITLIEEREENGGERNVWSVQRDLLRSGPFARDFVVEMDNERRACLRFGDGDLGSSPSVGSQFNVTYRVSDGRSGNIGPDTLAHIVGLDKRVTRVRNLVGGYGEIEPEPVQEVQMYAPYAFRTEDRCVTEEDYTSIASRHPEVERAVTRLRWTGSWQTAFIYVQRRGGKPVNRSFRQEIESFLEPYRIAGYDIEIAPPRFVSLDIRLVVEIAGDYSRAAIKRKLLAIFSNVDLAIGVRGFFHPDNFTFGEPLFLSQVIARAMEVKGVLNVEAKRFQRLNQPSQGELEAGRLDVGPLEIIRLQNDSKAPGHGIIRFSMKGGV